MLILGISLTSWVVNSGLMSITLGIRDVYFLEWEAYYTRNLNFLPN